MQVKNTLSPFLRTVIIACCASTLMLTACSNSQPANKTTVINNEITPVDSLKERIAAYIKTKNTNIGVAILGIEHRDSLSINGQYHYAMMSVCKFPQALTLLHMTDEGRIDKNHLIHFGKEDMKQYTHSTLQQDHPQKEFQLTIPEALTYSIGQSDNVTSNSIFKLEGGPASVETYIHSLGVTDIGAAVDYWHLRPDTYHQNWITPTAAVTLLDKFYQGKILSDSNRNMLWKIMAEGPSGRNRLPADLPPNTVVAQKTGTSGRDSAGVVYAFNDIGIVTLPNGKHFAIAVFISQSAHTDDDNAKIIAEICKMAWDHFVRVMPKA